MEDILWVDTANQIDNSWNKPTIVGLLFENNHLFYSITIETKYKLRIKNKLSDYEERVVVNNLQAYLVFLCCTMEGIKFEISKTYLCPDVRPYNDYNKYLEKCFAYHGKIDLFRKMKFKCQPSNIKSKAHNKLKKIYKKKRQSKFIFNNFNLNSFLTYFQKQSIKKNKKGW
jgi:hypothetical protein